MKYEFSVDERLSPERCVPSESSLARPSFRLGFHSVGAVRARMHNNTKQETDMNS